MIIMLTIKRPKSEIHIYRPSFSISYLQLTFYILPSTVVACPLTVSDGSIRLWTEDMNSYNQQVEVACSSLGHIECSLMALTSNSHTTHSAILSNSMGIVSDIISNVENDIQLDQLVLM